MVDEWYAIASSPLSSDTITVTESGGSSHDEVIVAFGISGAHIAAPFDTHSGLPVRGRGTTGTPTVTGVSTTNANDMILAFAGYAGSSTVETAQSGYTLIASQTVTNTNAGASEEEIVSAAQTGATVTFGTAPAGINDWVMFVDAVRAGP